MKKLSIIIVSYNNIDILNDCLQSIKKHNDIGDCLEVIVSDNSDNNTVVDFVREKYSWVKTVKNSNIGFGTGNNRGFEVSTGEYLLFLNPDTIIIEPIFKFAIEQFQRDPQLVLFGIQLMNKSMKTNPSFYFIDRHGIIYTLLEKMCRSVGCYIDGKMYIAGADLFVRRNIFEVAGKFDENIFMYNEEPDLIKRIKAKSNHYKTAFFKNKKMIHLEGGTSQQDAQKEYNMRKRIIIADKYYAQKWNMDAKKILKAKCRYIKFKKILYIFTNPDKYEHQKKLISLFESEMKT